jgi:hypothetical protein
MIKDLYIKSPEDPNYQYGIFEHSDPIEGIISKIKTIFGTRQGAILGDLNFGVGLEDLIFETHINKLELEEKIKAQIYTYIDESKDYNISPKVSFGSSENSDFCLIDIFINNTKVVGILVR